MKMVLHKWGWKTWRCLERSQTSQCYIPATQPVRGRNHARADIVGPTYIRLGRPNNPIVYGPDEKFEIGKAKVLRKGNNDRVLVVAAGITLFEALKAYDELKKSGTDIRVVDLFSVQPIDVKHCCISARCRKPSHHRRRPLLARRTRRRCAIGAQPQRHPSSQIAVTEIPHSGKPQELVEKFAVFSSQLSRR